MIKDLKTLFHALLPNNENWKVQLLSNWDTILGNLKTKVHLEKIYDDTLVLGVYDSCWMQELYLLSDMLIKKINEKLDQPRIKHLRFKKIGVQKKNSTSRSYAPPINTKKVVLNAHEKKALEALSDPQLREALEKFLIRCYQET